MTPSLSKAQSLWLGGLLVALAALLAVACGGQEGSTLKTGDAAPQFTLTATDGSTVSLSDYVGKKNVLLYFSMGSG